MTSPAEKAAREYVSENCGRDYPTLWRGDDDSPPNFTPQDIDNAFLAGVRYAVEEMKESLATGLGSNDYLCALDVLEALLEETK
jgi:hypothetical protein